MRHVDDAHHAEGDGKADRGEQQHRAERQAVPDVLPGGPERKMVLDLLDACLDIGAQAFISGRERG
jgi:hypothetical protein